jgi:hypothetical protein
MPAVLLQVPGFDPFDQDAEPELSHGHFTQAVDRMRGGERHAVIGPNRARQANFLEGPLKDRQGEFLVAAHRHSALRGM